MKQIAVETPVFNCNCVLHTVKMIIIYTFIFEISFCPIVRAVNIDWFLKFCWILEILRIIQFSVNFVSNYNNFKFADAQHIQANQLFGRMKYNKYAKIRQILAFLQIIHVSVKFLSIYSFACFFGKSQFIISSEL